VILFANCGITTAVEFELELQLQLQLSGKAKNEWKSWKFPFTPFCMPGYCTQRFYGADLRTTRCAIAAYHSAATADDVVAAEEHA
jgi:hypothetical protein